MTVSRFGAPMVQVRAVEAAGARRAQLGQYSIRWLTLAVKRPPQCRQAQR